MPVTDRALILDGQRPQGLEYLQRAVAIRPRRPGVWEALAAGFEAAGQPTMAAQCRHEASALTTSVPAGDLRPSRRPPSLPATEVIQVSVWTYQKKTSKHVSGLTPVMSPRSLTPNKV